MQWTDRLGYRLKLRDLHILLAVVESGSMSKAAQRLAVSAPVVSKAVADRRFICPASRLYEFTVSEGPRVTVYGRWGWSLIRAANGRFSASNK